MRRQAKLPHRAQKGETAEAAVKNNLESVLPDGVGVGSGFVFDSEGKTSAQIDLILYERQFCPVFRLSDDVCYYPCEGVIAVGETKTGIGKKELEDIYRKIASVRKLNKFPRMSGPLNEDPGVVKYRNYLSNATHTIPGNIESNIETIQNSMSAMQIFGFGLGRSFTATPETMLKNTRELYGSYDDYLRPNVVLSLDNVMIQPLSENLVQVSWSPLGIITIG